MRVILVDYTNLAERMLVLAKQTRLLADSSAIDQVFSMSDEQVKKELEYAFKTISSSWEFVQYIFFLEGVSRAFTHQLVRHRVGFSFAQQTMRTLKLSNFMYHKSSSVRSNQKASEEIDQILEQIRASYARLLELGLKPEDARGILPTNILTNILVSCNLRSLSTLLEIRLCHRVQGEFRKVAWLMRKPVLKVHSAFAPILRPFCLRWWRCRFPTKAQNCPIFNDAEFSQHLLGQSPDPDTEKLLVEKWERLEEKRNE